MSESEREREKEREEERTRERDRGQRNHICQGDGDKGGGAEGALLGAIHR